MSVRSDLEAKGIALTVDMKLQLSIIDCKPLWKTSTFPSTQTDAKKLLNNLLGYRRMESKYSKEHHEIVLKLLHTFPQLACHKFGQRRRLAIRACPFFHMVGAKGVSIESLQAMYDLNKEAIEEEAKYEGYYPLHYACESCASRDVIEFLLQNYRPAIFSQCQPSGKLPIHYALSMYRTSLETIQLLVEQYPESLTTREHEASFSPLDCACNNSCNPALVGRLVGLSYPQDLEEVRIGIEGYVDILRVSPELMRKCLAIVVPRVKRVMWAIDGWKEEHMLEIFHLMRQHCVNVQITLYGSHIQKYFLFWNEMQNLFTESTILQRVHISNESATRGTRNQGENISTKTTQMACLNSLNSFHPYLEALALEGFSFPNDSLPYSSLSNVHVKEFRLITCTIDSYDATLWRRSRVESVVIEKCFIDGNHLMKILNLLALMPMLKALTLISGGGEDMEPGLNVTEPIVKILKRYKLETLTVTGYEVTIDPIYQVLKGQKIASQSRLERSAPTEHHQQECHIHNRRTSQLRECNILPALHGEEQKKNFSQLFPDNLTLKKVRQDRAACKSSKHGTTIAYYTVLNRFQRGRMAEGSHLSTSDLVEILQSVKCSLTDARDGMEVHQILYGLLRFAPGMWSSFHGGIPTESALII